MTTATDKKKAQKYIDTDIFLQRKGRSGKGRYQEGKNWGDRSRCLATTARQGESAAQAAAEASVEDISEGHNTEKDEVK